MDHALYQAYIDILREELVPATGCTEPIAIAYASAKARALLGVLPEKVNLQVSANIIKNVKSVVVPNTGGLRGIAEASASGIAAGNADAELEVISDITDEGRAAIREYLKTAEITVEGSDSDYIFDIIVTVRAAGHYALCRIAGFHTNIIRLEKDGEIILDVPYTEQGESHAVDRSLLSVENIVAFAECLNVADVHDILSRQIKYNMAIAEAGLAGNYGARIGRIILDSFGDSVQNRAKAWAAAGSDARMNGCSMPVIINSGSGNQGITASVPVIIYAKDMNADDDLLYRALAVSNLTTIHLKTGIGRLSAYCGAISAGCGAAAGIAYLHGGRVHQIAHTLVNAVAINSGVICDGAKSSCAAKIASAVDAGLLGLHMYKNNSQFYGGDGIVTKGVENTIVNVGRLARKGMAGTDKEIIDIMISC